MDLTGEVPAADLQMQLDYALKPRDMQSAVTDALKMLDSVKEQLQQIEKTVKDRMPDASKDLEKAISDQLKQVESLQNSLARSEAGLGFGGRAEIADKLGNFFSMVDGVNAAPTPYQVAYFDELQKTFREKMDDMNKFVSQTIPQLNETLRKANAPIVVAGKPIEVPR